LLWPDGQAVPAGEKVVSLFEPHADIILRGARDVQYGHKLNLVTGHSGSSSMSCLKRA
jgi:IS5 family transposase